MVGMTIGLAAIMITTTFDFSDLRLTTQTVFLVSATIAGGTFVASELVLNVCKVTKCLKDLAKRHGWHDPVIMKVIRFRR
jgi:hypothetical protein